MEFDKELEERAQINNKLGVRNSTICFMSGIVISFVVK
jgi:hypothetical protein